MQESDGSKIAQTLEPVEWLSALHHYFATMLHGLRSTAVLLGLLLMLDRMVHAKRRIIMDSTQDNPSITALLMALQLCSSPNSDVEFLGAITTDTPELEQLHQLLDMANLSTCMPPILSIEETELYPVYGDVLEKAPETVQFLLDKVNEYPGEVVLYSSGSLAAYSMASQLDEQFDSKLAEVCTFARVLCIRLNHAVVQ